MADPLPLARDVARRFLVARQLLAPPRTLPARPESVLAVVERLGSLQFDPLEVPGARNHELVLHARVRGFRREWLARWLYGPPAERRLFEAWNKGLSILPVEELAWHRVVWDAAAARYGGFLDEQRATARRIVDEIARAGARSTAAFGRGEAIDWWWGTTSLNRAVIDVLFLCGRLGIARREGNTRSFDLLERLLPAEVLGAARPTAVAARRHRLLSRVRGVGLLGEVVPAELVGGLGTPLERRADLAALVDAGALIEVALEGARGRAWMLAADRPLLAARPPRRRKVAFLAPLDPLLWDRKLLRALWDFDYSWEVYTPVAKRRWGYYVLPVLFGDRLVGRIEPRFERAARRLDVLNLWLEDGVDPDEPGLAAGFAEALEAYRRFVGAETVAVARAVRGKARALIAGAGLAAPRRASRSAGSRAG